MTEARYDVVILGGGPAGLATAIGLRRLPGMHDVTLLVAEAGAAGRLRVGESAPPALPVPLGQLGLMERFRADGHHPCPGTASVWGRDEVGHNDFLYDPMGPAWRLDRRRFDAMLAEAARQAGAELAFDRPFLGAERSGPGWRLHLGGDAPRSVTARWVVDATGPRALFARSQGVGRLVDDSFFACARFPLIQAGKLTLQTLLEAGPQGWWYAARLPDGRAIVMAATDRAGLRSIADDAGWREALAGTRLIGPRLAPLTLDWDGAPMIEPIQSGRLERLGGPGWLAVGDAAASYDPISSQGVYKALADAVEVARLLSLSLHGEAGNGLAAREAAVAARFEQYRANRAYLYGLESRWPDMPFWRGRQGRPPSPSGISDQDNSTIRQHLQEAL